MFTFSDVVAARKVFEDVDLLYAVRSKPRIEVFKDENYSTNWWKTFHNDAWHIQLTDMALIRVGLPAERSGAYSLSYMPCPSQALTYTAFLSGLGRRDSEVGDLFWEEYSQHLDEAEPIDQPVSQSRCRFGFSPTRTSLQG